MKNGFQMLWNVVFNNLHFFLPLSKLLETALKKIKGNNSEDLLRVVSLGILTFSKIKNLGTMVKIFLIQQSDEYWVKYR